jgi:hypothetical protein
MTYFVELRTGEGNGRCSLLHGILLLWDLPQMRAECGRGYPNRYNQDFRIFANTPKVNGR